MVWEFPGSPVVRTLCLHLAEAVCSIPGWGTKILQTVWLGQKKKKENWAGVFVC